MAHDDHYHCFDHAGSGVLATRTDTFLRAGSGSSALQFYSLTKDLHALVNAHPTRCDLHTRGTTPVTAGATAPAAGEFANGGRDLWLLRVGTDFDVRKPKILFTAGQHAREWISVTYVFLVAEWLLNTYPTSGSPAANTPAGIAKNIVDNFHVYFVPMCNPDGHEYTVMVDRDFRKNSPEGDPSFKRRPGGQVVGPIAGANPSVDTNRCFHTDLRDAVIASGRGSWSSNVIDDTFIGNFAGNSKEVQLLEFLMRSQDFDVVVDHHSYGCFVMSAPGDDQNLLTGVTGTRFDTFRARMVDLLNNRAAIYRTGAAGSADVWQGTQSSRLYSLLFGLAPADAVIPGALRDHAFYLVRPATAAHPKTLALGMELPPVHYIASPGFQLPETSIQSVFKSVIATSLAVITHANTASPTTADFDFFKVVA